jgi:hypothetical protein
LRFFSNKEEANARIRTLNGIFGDRFKPREWPTTGLPHSDGSDLFRRILAHERFTLKAHVEATARLNKYLLEGTIPADVQARLCCSVRGIVVPIASMHRCCLSPARLERWRYIPALYGPGKSTRSSIRLRKGRGCPQNMRTFVEAGSVLQARSSAGTGTVYRERAPGCVQSPDLEILREVPVAHPGEIVDA